jgi:hypothetical protein
MQEEVCVCGGWREEYIDQEDIYLNEGWVVKEIPSGLQFSLDPGS